MTPAPFSPKRPASAPAAIVKYVGVCQAEAGVPGKRGDEAREVLQAIAHVVSEALGRVRAQRKGLSPAEELATAERKSETTS